MDWKLLCSSLLFVFVTVIKLLFPEQTEDIRKQTVALIDMDMNYRIWATEVGSMLTDESVYEVVEIFEDVDDEVEPDVASKPITTPMLDDLQEASPGDALIDRVEAFHLSQEAYAAYETPENVSYEYLKLPFSFAAPVSGVCSSGFGYRVHPIEGEVMFHYGTDFDVKEGTAILSFADGTVAAVGEEAGYGKYIYVDHHDGWKTLYAHCRDVQVTAGQVVGKGDRIGESGQTGRVTGPHLHFELMREGIYTNPEFFLA